MEVGALRTGASLLRDVSGVLRSKGKTERMMCGRTPGVVGGLRVTRLDRASSEPNAAWDDAVRGDVLRFEPPLSADKPRVEPGTTVERTKGEGTHR
jgi:hypothetical protein